MAGALLVSLVAMTSVAVAADPPPPPGPPKLANLTPIAWQNASAVIVYIPVILPREGTYAGSGGKPGMSGRFFEELLRINTTRGAVTCGGRLTGNLTQPRPLAGLNAFRPQLPPLGHVPSKVRKAWLSLPVTKSELTAMAICKYGLAGRMKLANQTLNGSWTLKYGAFWTGKPGTLSRRFVIRGMCDRPGCPITGFGGSNPYITLKVSG
jgi:hypothetical protein